MTSPLAMCSAKMAVATESRSLPLSLWHGHFVLTAINVYNGKDIMSVLLRCY